MLEIVSVAYDEIYVRVYIGVSIVTSLIVFFSHLR